MLFPKKLKLISPDVNFFVKKIQDKEYFSFAKINHAFWEALLNRHDEFKRITTLHSVEFINEIEEMVKSWPLDDSLMLGLGSKGYASSDDDPHDSKEIIVKILKTIPRIKTYDALVWKSYCLNNQIEKFFRSIRSKVVVYGLSHLKNINDQLKFINFEFREVGLDATAKKDEIIKDLESNHKEETVYCFQMGEMLSTWVIRKLHGLPESYFIDFGRSLDFFVKDISFSESDLEIYKKMSNGDSPYNHFPNIKNQLWLTAHQPM